MAIYNDDVITLVVIGFVFLVITSKKFNFSCFHSRGRSKTIYCTFHIQRNVGMKLESVPN